MILSHIHIATLGLEESPVGWPKSSIIFTRNSQPANQPANQPADHLSLYYILSLADLNSAYSFLGKEEKRKKGNEEKRKKGKEERRKDVKRSEGKKDRP